MTDDRPRLLPNPHSGPPSGPTVDLIVLAGGRGSRLGGTLKAAVEVAGRSLLSRVLDARSLARHTVVVGPDSARHAAPEGESTLLWTLEDPPFGGPVEGIAAGLAALAAQSAQPTADWILLLACDLPWAADAAPLLWEAAAASNLPPHLDGFHLTDASGRAQWLVAIYRSRALTASVAALGAEVRGASMHALLSGLALRGLPDPTGASRDVDTWQDVADSTDRLRRGATPAAESGTPPRRPTLPTPTPPDLQETP